MSVLWFLIDALGMIAQTWIAFALFCLAVLILSLPRLLGLGLLAGCRGVWTLLIPARRTQWLRDHRKERERRRAHRAEIDLLNREVREYGRDEALRRSDDRRYHRITGTGQDSQEPARSTGPARPDEEPA